MRERPPFFPYDNEDDMLHTACTVCVSQQSRTNANRRASG